MVPHVLFASSGQFVRNFFLAEAPTPATPPTCPIHLRQSLFIYEMDATSANNVLDATAKTIVNLLWGEVQDGQWEVAVERMDNAVVRHNKTSL
jgi:hypothetical protein